MNGELWVLSAQEASCKNVQELLGADFSRVNWRVQPLDVFCYQFKLSLKLSEQGWAELVSDLAKTGANFEVEIFSRPGSIRYLHHRALGIIRLELDEAGEILLRGGAMEHLMMQCRGSVVDFNRGLRRLLGTSWNDLLEPYRRVSEELINLTKAV
ncbi:DUF3145 family protein [Candidatus Aquiluna sp. UB-MaderosW2red]|uniref:DUF3145 family protein n=1 Tax=Candidatus Aquiluna sp. UB-MaderosW2red TaxID=1855377 RepID=UPI000875B2DB|nr:DUF3145 family protein [Candidatus Aquiluna sp. UB-MaderosW2red]SCX10868.1 Protein of unknown function [Candidatus Aquiluna sp. UB-MaderosW2red]